MKEVAFVVATLLLAGGLLFGAGQSGDTTSSAVAPTDIDVWLVINGSQRDYIANTIVDGFAQKHPDINPKIGVMTWQNVGEKVLTSFAADASPDIFMQGAEYLPLVVTQTAKSRL